MGLECNEATRAGCYASHRVGVVGGCGCRCACHFDPTALESIQIQIKPWVARRLDAKTRELGRIAVDAAIERLIVQALDDADKIPGLAPPT